MSRDRATGGGQMIASSSLQDLYKGFEHRTVELEGGIRIAATIGGSGTPVLLLHGHPQTRAIWHRVAPELARHHTVVATDLRGYGDSSKPRGAADHANYSKRQVARDQVNAMRALGFERFGVLAHDRGARGAHRLAM